MDAEPLARRATEGTSRSRPSLAHRAHELLSQFGDLGHCSPDGAGFGSGVGLNALIAIFVSCRQNHDEPETFL